MKHAVWKRSRVVALGASCLLACGSESEEAQQPQPEPESMDAEPEPGDDEQLLSYTCRQDETKRSTPLASVEGEPVVLRAAGRRVGVAVSADRLSDPAYAATVAAHFNQLTAENEMKWDAIEPQPGVFDFSRADAIVSFARDNDMQVRGHALVWHSQLPSWMEQLTGADAVREAMTRHIQTVVTHFRDTFPGTVVAWDVVNEAMNVMQGPMGGMAIYRDSVFYRELGEGFIAEAFQIARAADPDVALFYNDFGVEGTNGAKSNGTFDMVSALVAAGVPVDGIGFQMHTGPLDQGPNAADFAANVARYAALGLEIEVTEMDVSLCSIGTNVLGLELQRFRYNRILSACFESPACRSVSLWGVADANSWLNMNGCTQGMLMLETLPSPLAFDDAHARKPAWWGIYDALSGCTYE
jgi:endo-1,4-beta-xylanase